MTGSLSTRRSAEGLAIGADGTVSDACTDVSGGLQGEGEVARLEPAPFTGPVGRQVQPHREQARQLLATRSYCNPVVFGSVARGTDHADSDVDVLVDPPAGVGLIQLIRTSIDLETLLKVRVDLIPRTGLRPRVGSTIAAEAVPL